MKATKQWIEDCWVDSPFSLLEIDSQYNITFQEDNGDEITLPVETLLMCPDFWQAVGKTRGWDDGWKVKRLTEMETWKKKWHTFIDHRAEGKTIEEALTKIT